MNLKQLFLSALIAILLTSCMSLALSVTGIYKKEAEQWVYSNNDKTLVFIPMKHIGPKEFYAGVKHKIDSLTQDGYIVFLESTRLTDSLTLAQKDTVNWKIRKMLGIPLSKNGYIDTLNGRLMGRKFSNKKGLINQPKYSLLGADTLTGHIVDVPLNEVIKEYENRNGEIQLNVCDFTTPLKDKYDCGREPRAKVNAIILDYRNKHLADAIANDKHKKIAILYGALHRQGVYTDLKAIDSAWAPIPKK